MAHCSTYFTFDDMVDERPRDVAQKASQLASEGHHQVLQRVQFCVQVCERVSNVLSQTNTSRIERERKLNGGLAISLYGTQ